MITANGVRCGAIIQTIQVPAWMVEKLAHILQDFYQSKFLTLQR